MVARFCPDSVDDACEVADHRRIVNRQERCGAEAGEEQGIDRRIPAQEVRVDLIDGIFRVCHHDPRPPPALTPPLI